MLSTDYRHVLKVLLRHRKYAWDMIDFKLSAVPRPQIFKCYTESAEQYVRDTRRTLILDAVPNKCECLVTDKDDGDIQFTCSLSQEGIVCRNYKTMLDLVSVGSIQHMDNEKEPLGVYYSLEGYKDGQIAKIVKGKTFSRTKYQLNLVTEEERKMLLTRTSNAFTTSPPLPLLKQSLVVVKQRRHILKIVTKTDGIPIAALQKEMSSQRYWLHIEPSVDCCFVSAIAAYLLRKRIFGDRLPKVLRSPGNAFSRRARRLSLSLRRIKRPRPNSTTNSSVR